jgi:formylglycine-generating enzyme required for sulfatase activity
MAGNVFEWCNDRWACSLGTAADSDPVGPAVGSFRVFRGGTWSLSDYPLRRANRNCDIPEIKAYDLGFRIVRTAIP